MLIRKGIKFRLEPTALQRGDMTRFAGHNRAVWNKALALTKDRLERKIPIIWFHELNWNMTTLWKKSEEMYWLNDAPSQSLQQTLKQFERAMRDCFDKNQPNKRMPRFKRKGEKDSFVFPQGFTVEGNRIKLPKLGWVKFRKSRDLEGKARSVTVTRNGKHWDISVLCENAMIFMEQLGISRMSKSAKGTSEKHGVHVKAKSGLNKSILDAGWGMFARMLEYKQEWMQWQPL